MQYVVIYDDTITDDIECIGQLFVT